MDRNFARALALVLKYEGGYVNNPKDPGGATNKGVTIATFRRYVKPGGTIAELKAITDAQVATVYRKQYWDAVDGDGLPSGIDFAMFDFAVNSGPGRALKCPHGTVDELCDARLAFMKRAKDKKGRLLWPTFGKGWAARVADVRKNAKVMAGSGSKAPTAPKQPAKPATPAAPVLTAKQVNSVMHLGSKGDFVKTLQQNLNTLGYPRIDPDGIFGKDTDTNVRAFQKDARLELVDGWAGPATVTAIAKELEKRKTAPKMAAAEKVVDDAAGSDGLGGFSKTEVVTTVTGLTGTATAVKEGVDAVKESTTSFMDLATTIGPWVLLALVLAGGAGYIIYERRRKRLEAVAVKRVL